MVSSPRKVLSWSFGRKNILPKILDSQNHLDSGVRVSISPGMKYHELISSNFLWVNPSFGEQSDGTPCIMEVCMNDGPSMRFTNNKFLV